MAEQAARIEAVARTGLFDAAFYVRDNRLGPLEAGEALRHYCDVGEALGFKPNALFDPLWYHATYECPGDGALLAHYAETGEPAGYSPSPVFDAPWYRERTGAEAPLRHYLRHRGRGAVSPNPFFDTAYFVEGNDEVAATGLDPFEYYLARGVFEGRRPSPAFDPDYVWRRYLNGDRSKNPYILFLQFYRLLGWTGAPDPAEPTVGGEIGRFTTAGPDFEPRPVPAGASRRVKVLAFYLPQFHAIPENDVWWGAGFTEWRNVPRGVPRFEGHYQPRIPRDLGFYELDGTAVMRRQVQLARNAGVHGFCFYYYNFNGRRLLERPLDAYVAEGIGLPFCLMWANENWSRRWDGRDQDVLIRQDYRPDDAPALVADLARYLKDPRYIRAEGRPILFFYRADVIPAAARTLGHWRSLFAEEHGLEPLFVMAQTFGNTDPRRFGFDAAVEFPPHKFGGVVPPLNGAVRVLETAYEGDVRGYDDVVAASLADFPADYPLIKTVVPGWDNEARRPGRGLALHGSTPVRFHAWVEQVAARIEAAPVFGERFLCVNAWNEWAEGAYLEPDVHYGYAYLNALARGVSRMRHGGPRKILLVGHNAYLAGAQQLLLHMGQVLRFRFGVEVAYVLLGEGGLIPRYEAVAPTFAVNGSAEAWTALVARLGDLRRDGFGAAIVNSAFSGLVLPILADLGFTTCSLVHELGTLVARFGGSERLQQVLARADHVVFPSVIVEREIAARFGAPARASSVMPQGVYKELPEPEPDGPARVRAELGLAPGTRLVVNAGFADLRKGIDLFVALARLLQAAGEPVAFAWIGDADPAVDAWLLDAVRADPASNIRLVPYAEQIAPYFQAADLFLLTSREDPFPSVLLEALGVGLPVLAFRGAGGFVGLLDDPRLGLLLPPDDLAGAARLIAQAAGDEAAHAPALVAYRRRYVAEHHDFGRYCFEVMRRASPAHSVSVVVPNHDCARFLEERLASIFNQSYPVFEVMVLDAASTDDSVGEIERVAGLYGRELTLVESPVTAGHVSHLWRTNIARARGDLVWIAAADDLAEAAFLEELASFFDRPETVFAFSDSRLVDHDGAPRARSYKPLSDTLPPGTPHASTLFDGQTFVGRFAAARSVIAGPSTVLWRRDILVRCLEECGDALGDPQVALDCWPLYEQACRYGLVGHHAKPLGLHRPRDAGTTRAAAGDGPAAGTTATPSRVIRRGGMIDLAGQRSASPADPSRPSNAPLSWDTRSLVEARDDALEGGTPPRSRA